MEYSVIPQAVSVIQVALTPVFLLAGTAGCLNVFAQRLARVSDRVNRLFDVLQGEENLDAARVRQLTELRRRTLALEGAVILGTMSGVFTCLATLGLLIGAIRQEFREQILLWFFGAAVVALIGSFVAFLVEMIITGRAMLRQIENDREIRRRHRGAVAARKHTKRADDSGQQKGPR
ncbi:DUF2721 domain-containing protein [Rhizobium sp. RAF56]|uniref:DUF2721 domain-containing protein n=1 Tax=Rhizobium sp. RAF56 TaxID=3233062 RepID=UPI003F971623